MERDKLLDHLDAVLVGVGGSQAFAPLERAGNHLQRSVHERCSPSPAYDPCRIAFIDDPATMAQVGGAEADFRGRVEGLEGPVRDLLNRVAHLRLVAQITREPDATFVGPPSSVSFEQRLDDTALEQILTTRTPEQFRAALEGFLSTDGVDRSDARTLEGSRADILRENANVVSEMTEIFRTAAADYAPLVMTEVVGTEAGLLGSTALLLAVPLEAARQNDFSSATFESFAEARAAIARGMFDQLYRAAGRLHGGYREQAVAYALLALTPTESLDVHLAVDMNLRDTFFNAFTHYRRAGYAPLDVRASGSAVDLLGGGFFDVNALMDVESL